VIHERDLQSKCIEWVKSRDIYTLNNHGDAWGGKGKADLVMCVNGLFVAAELKVGENGLSSAQKLHKLWIERNGGIFFSPYTLKEFIEKMEGIIKNE
jgi:hypothetical protein